ncbi:hypothetical protein TI10_13970 [Photorhabdus luminescens subsp. luminescens]|nr:hypothetical protein TI10_13970 [Photorhabdus luminescens subsp. luminescens]
MLFFQIRRSLGQNFRLQLEGDRYCSILLSVDSIISIDRKLITLDTGFIRYSTASQSVIMIPDILYREVLLPEFQYWPD